MATSKKPDDSGFVGNLAERGEKAVNRLMEELAHNPRVTDALSKAMSAKGRVDAGARKTLSQFGVAAADELADLRKQIERLERRLARVEGTTTTTTKKPASSAKRSETKKKPTAKKKTTTTTTKASTKKTPSPSAGRSVGGGTGRGSTPGGGSAAT
jgi:septal ring factor EnvC (AmiA/AmiB activator)